MPFTPLHLGPGAALKAATGPRMSFMVFGGAQVLIDLEPLYKIATAQLPIHGLSHTFAGATLIGLVAGAIGRPISEPLLRALRIPHHPFTWSASFAGGLVGTWSHVLLDGAIHPDMHPYAPFSDAPAQWLGVVGHAPLAGVCLLLGVLALPALGWRWWRDGKG